MGQEVNNLNGDPSQLTVQQKMQLFEKSSENKYESIRQLTFYNNFAVNHRLPPNRSSLTTTSENNITSSATHSINNTSTPVSMRPKYDNFHSITKRNPPLVDHKWIPKSSSHQEFGRASTARGTDTISRIHDQNSSSHYHYTPESQVKDKLVNMKVFHDRIQDLDAFLTKELTDIQTQKRIGLNNQEQNIRENKSRDIRYNEQILDTLQSLKSEIHEIKLNQKGIEEKIRKQEELQYTTISARFNQELAKKVAEHRHHSDSSVYNFSSDQDLKKKTSYVEKKSSQNFAAGDMPITDNNIPRPKDNRQKTHNSPVLAESGYSRDERIHKLEAEIYKEETLMMKINRVLENLKNVDDRNLLDIVNIERHYLVASTRFQSALSELKKLKEGMEVPRSPPYNRNGRILIRDIMLEVKQSSFKRPIPIKNEFLLAMMKHDDKIYATKPMRIIDGVSIVKFPEKFSIPDAYVDFEMRLEIYGTTFWRKNATLRETMLKKYGFVTFTLADTGKKPKRFQMIEVLQSDNIPIRNKVIMKVSQQITTEIKYKETVWVKWRDVWHEATGFLNGHLLELTFKKIHNSGITQSQETMLLDMYNVDSDAVIPIDPQRISDKPFSFLLKFNHCVDSANFYLMLAANSSDSYFEWINTINKVLVLIK